MTSAPIAIAASVVVQSFSGAYSLVLAAAVLLAGLLGDRLGRTTMWFTPTSSSSWMPGWLAWRRCLCNLRAGVRRA